jgi:ribosomal-protein-alanine N-acetyltransferase
MSIRRATINDITKIVALENQVFHETLGEKFLYDEMSINPFSRMYVIEDQSRFIGFIGLRIDEQAELMNFAIDPIYQHQGYGHKLMTYALEELKKEDVSLLTLEVRESNQNARHFYESCGFKVSHKRKQYYPNEDAIVYMKEVEK